MSESPWEKDHIFLELESEATNDQSVRQRNEEMTAI